MLSDSSCMRHSCFIWEQLENGNEHYAIISKHSHTNLLMASRWLTKLLKMEEFLQLFPGIGIINFLHGDFRRAIPEEILLHAEQAFPFVSIHVTINKQNYKHLPLCKVWFQTWRVFPLTSVLPRPSFATHSDSHSHLRVGLFDPSLYQGCGDVWNWMVLT